jgi:molybdopterin molybdotransferase
MDLPPFDNSAMDGYALRAADVSSARTEAPVSLRVIGQVAAGRTFLQKIEPGTCVRIFTGSPLPPNADAVVMQEDTRVNTDKRNEVLVLDTVKPWESVRFRGEDVKSGSLLCQAGEIISPTRAGLLAAVGVEQIKTRPRPRVGLLATGSELVAPGQPLGPGQIFESNRIMLTPLLASNGAIPRLYPLVPDTLSATRAALGSAFAECDAVITTGGASVGELDWVKKAFEDLGGRMEFWRVAIKPGKPFVYGRWQEKFLFGLPGNPVSSFVTFLLLVRPALLRWQGAREISLPVHHGVLAETLINRGDRRHFVRVTLDLEGQVHSAGTQASHLLRSLAAANGLVDVPPNASLERGVPVPVLTWGGA